MQQITALEELLGDRLRVLGPDHPDTLTTRFNLAYWRDEVGDVAGAAAVFEELLADSLRRLGPDHPQTLAARRELARWPGAGGYTDAEGEGLVADLSVGPTPGPGHRASSRTGAT